MTTYSDTSEVSDTFDDSAHDDSAFDDASLEGGCCCAPEVLDVEPAYSSDWDQPVGVIGDDLAGIEDLGGTDEPLVPAAPLPAAPVAGVGNESDWHASGSGVEDLYPTVGTIGGDPFGAMTITPADDVAPVLGHDLSTIGGGNPYGAITITVGDGGPPVSATSGTIAPSHTSTVDVLGSLYGMTSDKGSDILTQALVNKSINGIQATTVPWSSPLVG